MSIDPRTIKQLLQIQFTSKLNLSSDDKSVPNEAEDSTFKNIIQYLMGQNIEEQPANTGKATPAALFAQGSLDFHPSSPSTYDPLINQASSKYGVKSSLIKAVIDAESSFNTHVVSSAGAKGLMQLMDDTGKGLGVTDPFDPQQNIKAGTQFLADLLKEYNGSEAMALAAYNGGPGRLARLGIHNEQQLFEKYNHLPTETQNYVHKVLNLKQSYHS